VQIHSYAPHKGALQSNKSFQTLVNADEIRKF